MLNELKKIFSLELPNDEISKNKEYGRTRDHLKYVYPSVFKYWKLGLFSYSVLLISALLTFPMPMLNKFLIDKVILTHNMALLIPIILIMVLIGLIKQTSDKIQRFTNQRFDQKVILDIQEKLLARVLSLPKSFFDKIQRGYLMSRLNGDLEGIKWFFSNSLVQGFINLIQFIGGVVFLFYLEWRIALPVILFLPLSLISTHYFARKSYIMGHYGIERHARFYSTFQEVISTIPLIKSFSSEKRSISKITGEIELCNRFANQQLILNSINTTVQDLIPRIADYFVLGFGAYWVIKGNWTLGSLLAFKSYMSYVYTPLNFLSSSVNQFQNSRASLHRTAALFESIPEDNINTGKFIDNLNGSIEFKNVSFKYIENKNVLENVSFKINSGEHWAVVGESGVGKTTLISLILRFYIPQHGNILFDGETASIYNIRNLRKHIGYVSQSTLLLSGTILDNLKYGNEDASFEEVCNAARVAEIYDFIDSLPDKFNTVLTENGINLSEGQKQRLSIARALVKNPDILILDEPTSSLDNITEHSIYSHMPQAVKGKTTITIAHRLGTIRNADKVIMLRKNKAPLIGGHEDLLKNETDYKNFFQEL